jgi:hypothetical protein
VSYELLISPDLGGAGGRIGEIIRDGFGEVGIEVRPVEVDNAALENAIFEDGYRIFDLARGRQLDS